MLSGRSSRWVRRALAIGLGGLLAASLLSSTAAGQTTSECPAAVPTSELRDGTSGYGWTVADGRTREQFTWTYLGTLEDAIGPGRDVIIVDTGGPVIERHGGIFFGMSGSPLYTNDNRLVGALAYGLAYGPSSVAGVTPAEDIMRVLDYPRTTDEDDTSAARTRRMTWSERRKIAAQKSTQASDVGSSFSRLRVPVGISGVGGRGLERIQNVIERERLRLVPHAASSVGASQTTGATPQPGDNLSALLSYGDITMAGTGTVTVVCEGKLMAFGHPFFWEGETTFAGHGAETITVVEDQLFGAYELANVAEPLGRIDQDRLAGLRGFLGEATESIPITSSVSSLDTGLSREGQTTVVDQEPFPFVAFYHLYSNILVTQDEYGGGSSTTSFIVSGVTEDGTAWDLTRSNQHVSQWGISEESAFEAEIYLHSLLNNPFEEVEFSSFDATVTAQSEEISYEIDNVLVSTDGNRYRDRNRVRAAPGSTLYLRVMLLPGEDEPQIPVDLSVRVPRSFGEKSIQIAAPRFYDDRICLFRPKRCLTATGDKVDTLEEMIAVLEGRPTNNVLRAQLGRGGSADSPKRDEAVLDRVVTGRARIRVRIGCCSGGGGESGTAEPKHRRI